MLCAAHYDHIAFPAPKWSDAIEQTFQSSLGAEGGPEAVSIVWANRNTLSGAGDNFFDDVFGTSAPLAQGVVDAALAAWSRVITSFNRADGTSTLQINVSMNRDMNNNFVGGFGGAGGPAPTAPEDGLPRTGSITVNAGNLSANPNDNNGWFLDPTPNDYAEFQGDILTPFAANQTTTIGSDLFSLVTAEITHVLGFISAKPGSTSFSGYRLETSGFSHFTNRPDDAEGGGNKGFYYTFDGPTIDHLMTSYSSGDTDTDSWGNVIHTAGGTADISFAGKTWRGTEDDGNALYNAERLLPSHVTATILMDAYGYSIEPPAKFGSMYAVLDSVTGILNIRGADDSHDTISITRSGGVLTVAVNVQQDVPGSYNASGAFNAPAWTTEFNLAAISQVNVFPKSGDDTVLISADMGNIPVLVNGDLGADTLQVLGGAGYDSFSTPSSTSIITTNGQIAYASMDSLEIFTGNGDADVDLRFTNVASARVTGGANAQTINFVALDSGTATIIDLGEGDDVLNFATGPGVNPVQSPVTIFGVGGNDTFNIAPADFASTVITQPVTIHGNTGNDALILGSNNADSIDTNIVFDGGTHSGLTGDQIIINDLAPTYSVAYDIAPTVVTRDGISVPHTVTYSNAESIVVNAGSGDDTVIVRNGVSANVFAYGNNGNDNFIRGDGNVTATSGAVFNGGNGFDQITFDDHLRSGNLIWDLRNNEVIYGGIVLFETTNFESVGILAGNGDDEITFSGNLLQGFQIDAGGGADAIIVGFTSTAQFNEPVTVAGGDGNDTVTWRNGSRNWQDLLVGQVVTPVAINGGDGINTLIMDETMRTTSTVDIFQDRIVTREPAPFAFGADVNYANVIAITVTTSDQSNRLNVYSTDASSNYNLNGGDGADYFYMRSNPGQRNNVTINGQAGNDTLDIDDSVFSDANVSYALRPAVGILQDRVERSNGPLAITTYSYTSMQSLIVGGTTSANVFDILELNPNGPTTLHGWNGDDTFNLQRSTLGTALTINGGGGNDCFEITPVSKNLGANLSGGNNTFTYDGGLGSDTLGIHNDNNNDLGNSYTVDGTQLNILSMIGSPSFALFMQHPSVEHTSMTGGPKLDGMSVYTSAVGTTYDLNGGPGAINDYYVLGLPLPPSMVSGIRGAVNVDGSAGGVDTIDIYNSSDTIGRTVHIGTEFIGATPGDNLFGPGGYLHYSGIAGQLTVNLGSGPDTVYARPNATAPLLVRGNAPTTGAGDGLNLALADAENYVVNGTAASGNVTSTNLRTLTYTGFETGPSIDAIAPQVVAAGFDEGDVLQEDVHTLTFQFSEDVSNTLEVNSLVLINTTTNMVIPNSVMELVYDLGTNTASFTFPGYFAGRLPAGEYSASLAAAVSDFFGNSLDVAPPLLFTVTAVASTFTVNSTADPGDGICDATECTLREAIESANASPNVDADTPDQIAFDFSGAGPFTIQPTSALPEITDPVMLDGTTQAGYAGAPIIELDGSLAPGAHGLVVSAGKSTVRGLVINRFVGTPSGGIVISGAGGNVLQGNYIGTNLAGDSIFPAGSLITYGVILVGTNGNLIGTDGDGLNDAAEGNIISGQDDAGILLQVNAAENVIAGNRIGTSADGTSALGNGVGVRIDQGSNNTVGGSDPGAGNTIAFNTLNGISVNSGTGNNFQGNSIYGNSRLGIDLHDPADPANGVTPNDVGDADLGPNKLQNYPVITRALATTFGTTLIGTLDSAADANLRLEYFVSDNCHSSGHGPGQLSLGSVSVMTDANGHGEFSIPLPNSVSLGQFVTTTATDEFGNTSEFSACAVISNDIAGDFNHDGLLDALDIDVLVGEIAAGTNAAPFDLTGDALVNLADRDEWLSIAGAVNLSSGNPYLLGDANLDGVVDGSDFGIWNANKFTAVARWSKGDFSADGFVDGSDFGIWNSHKFTASDAVRPTSTPTAIDTLLQSRKFQRPTRMVEAKSADSLFAVRGGWTAERAIDAP